MRPSGRAADQMRAISIEPGFTKHAEGSVLIGFGETKVLVTASDRGTRSAFPARQGRRLGHRRIWHAPAGNAYPWQS